MKRKLAEQIVRDAAQVDREAKHFSEGSAEELDAVLRQRLHL